VESPLRENGSTLPVLGRSDFKLVFYIFFSLCVAHTKHLISQWKIPRSELCYAGTLRRDFRVPVEVLLELLRRDRYEIDVFARSTPG